MTDICDATETQQVTSVMSWNEPDKNIAVFKCPEGGWMRSLSLPSHVCVSHLVDKCRLMDILFWKSGAHSLKIMAVKKTDEVDQSRIFIKVLLNVQ